MQCSLCGLEMMIDHSEYLATGDASPDTPTRLYTVPYFVCRNPNCANCPKEHENKLVAGARIPLVPLSTI